MLRSARIATLLAAAGLATGLASAQTATHGEPLDAAVRPTQSVTPIAAPGNAFTYQGYLQESGAPVTTAVDVRFTLYNDAAGTSTVGGPITVTNITPDDGVFSTSLDFGVAALEPNEALWLGIEVSPAGAGTYDDLGLQALEAAPFALNTRGIRVDDIGNVKISGEDNLFSQAVLQLDSGQSGAQFAAIDFLDNGVGQWGVGKTPGNDFYIGNAIRILKSNNDVGIGTNTPDARLHVTDGNSGFAPSTGTKLLVEETGADNNYLQLLLSNGLIRGQAILFSDAPNSYYSAIFAGNTANEGFTFRTGGANNRMVIQADGNVGIGTTTPSHRLDVAGNVGISGGLFMDNVNAVADFDGRVRMFRDNQHQIGPTVYSNVALTIDTAQTFALYIQNGDAAKPGGGSWGNSSDRNLKKNIENLEGSLDTLLKLRGVNFEYKDPDAIGELHGVRTGFIAQEVEAVIPDWVGDGLHGKMVTIRGFEAMAVEAMRELKNDNDTLRNRVAALEERLDAASNTPILKSSLTWPAFGALALGGLAIARRRKNAAA